MRKRLIIGILIIFIGISSLIILILGLSLPNELLREIGIPSFITVFLSIVLTSLFKRLEKEEDRKLESEKRKNELKIKLEQIHYILEKGGQKSNPRNKVHIFFMYLDERITEFKSLLNGEQFRILEMLHSLTSNWSIIGFKNKDNIWVSRQFNHNISDLEGYIKNIEKMIERCDFEGSEFTYEDIKTNINKAEQQIILARREIDRRKKIEELVYDIINYCVKLIEN